MDKVITTATGWVLFDPELKTSESSGKDFTSVLVASNGYNGDSTFIKAIFFDENAERVANYMKKGSHIGLNGEMKIEGYEKDGEIRTQGVMLSPIWWFTGSKKKDDGEQASDDNGEIYE